MNSETPSFLLPIRLHNSNLNAVLKAVKGSNITVEVWSADSLTSYSDFVLDRRDPAFNTCAKYVYNQPSCEGDKCTCTYTKLIGQKIPHNKRIAYFALVEKCIMYQEY